MKTLVRLMSVCSIAMVGVVALPSVAKADVAQEEGPIGIAAQAMHEGHGKAFDRAVEATRLRPDQKEKVDRLRSEWRDRHEPVKKARNELMLAIADRIKDGNIDRCALSKEVKALASAKAKTRAGDRTSMEKLHSILDPEQRNRFVDSMRATHEEAEAAHTPQALVEKMDKELGLKDDQKRELREIISGLKQIRDAEPEHKEHKEHMKRVLDAFRGDHFVLDEVAPMEKDLEQRIEKRIYGRLWAGEAILPVLSEQQRTKLADKIRDKARSHTETESAECKQGEERNPSAEEHKATTAEPARCAEEEAEEY